MTDRLVILIPAAGQSSRMRGRDKLLEVVDNLPLISRQAMIAQATGLPTLVTLPPAAKARRSALANADVTLKEVPRASEGLAASMRIGASWAQSQSAAGLIILLADMPEIEVNDLIAMAESFLQNPDTVLRATNQAGRAGHPVILPARLFETLKGISGDCGARDIVKNETVRLHPLPGNRATTDLDTPEDWSVWRAARS